MIFITSQIPLVKDQCPFAEAKYGFSIKRIIFLILSALQAPTLIIRLPLAILVLFVSKFVILRMLSYQDINKPMAPLRRSILHGYIIIKDRLLLFLLGYYHIKETNKHLKPNLDRSYIIISNHVSTTDPLVLIAKGFACSYVSKDDVAKFPALGDITWALQSIFVKRNDKQSSSKCAQKIVERTVATYSDECDPPRKYPAICLFPEGTTVNQRYLLPFKKGAFMPGKPVSCILLKYDNKYSEVSDSCCSLLKRQIKNMLKLYNRAEIVYLGDYIPNEQEKQDCNLFAQNVRRFYQINTRWPYANYTLYDKYYFLGKYKDYSKCSQAWKYKFQEDVTAKNGYKESLVDYEKWRKQDQ